MKKSAMKKYWFKRRRYGYGWVPASWQGWTVFIVYLAVVLANVIVLVVTPFSSELLWFYLTTLITATVAVMIIATQTSPKPKWRWGKKSDDNSKEDF